MSIFSSLMSQSSGGAKIGTVENIIGMSGTYGNGNAVFSNIIFTGDCSLGAAYGATFVDCDFRQAYQNEVINYDGPTYTFTRTELPRYQIAQTGTTYLNASHVADLIAAAGYVVAI